jgi:protein gp37
MSDLFHPEVSEEFIIRIAKVMMEANWHTYQVLTKRSDRLLHLLKGRLSFATRVQHIWWGVSVEDQKYGRPRIEHLRSSSATVKFLSVEPLLEDLGQLDLSGIGWVIVGGESGPGARPMEESWVLNVLKWCEKYQVPFFFKQWGGVRKHKTGRELHGRTFDEFPETTRGQMPNRNARAIRARELEPHLLAR